MSSLPPPPPPPAVPTPPSVPPSLPPPPGQPSPAATGESAPKSGRTALIVVVAVLVVAAVGVGAFLLTRDDDTASQTAPTAAPETLQITTPTVPTTTGPATLDTAAMLAAVTELTARAEARRGESVDIDSCPGGDLALLAAKAPAEVRAVVETADQPSAFIYQPDLEREPAIINCTLDDESFATGVGLGSGKAVQPFRQDLIRVLPEFNLTFDGEHELLGGTVLPYCAEPKDTDSSFRAFCEADWFDDSVWVGVFVASDTKSSALADEWLVAILPEVVGNIAVNAPTVVIQTS